MIRHSERPQLIKSVGLGCVREFKLRSIRSMPSFAIKELPHPHFKVNERPEAFRVVLSTSLMLFDQPTDEVLIEKSTAHRAFA